jgi:hypothetical protein
LLIDITAKEKYDKFKEHHIDEVRDEMAENMERMEGMWKFCVDVLETFPPEETSNYIPLTPTRDTGVPRRRLDP